VNADWFYSVGDSRQGPVTEDALKQLVTEGRLQPTDLVWKDGMADWVEARTVPAFFPAPRVEPLSDDRSVEPYRRRFDADRPSRRGRDDDDDRPSRRGRDDDDDRPSRRGRRDDDEIDDDRPRIRRRDDDYGDRRNDDDYDRPRRRSKVKPGQVQGVGVMMLVGGIIALLNMLIVPLASGGICCLWPGLYYEIVIGILLLIRGINMMNQDDQGPPRTLAILQIICIVNGDVLNCVLGIVALVMLNDPKVQQYYLRKGFS
jgi:GYF domain 2